MRGQAPRLGFLGIGDDLLIGPEILLPAGIVMNHFVQPPHILGYGLLGAVAEDHHIEYAQPFRNAEGGTISGATPCPDHDSARQPEEYMEER